MIILLDQQLTKPIQLQLQAKQAEIQNQLMSEKADQARLRVLMEERMALQTALQKISLETFLKIRSYYPLNCYSPRNGAIR